MFEEVLGLPAHPLVVHAAVVLVPLLAALALGYAFLPVIRAHTRWVLTVVAVAAPLSALLAKLSGDAFFARMDAAGQITEGFYPVIEDHQQLGTTTLYATLGLAVVTLALVYVVRPGAPTVRPIGGAGTTRAVSVGVRLLTVLAAAVTAYYVYRTGESGASAVWSGH